jgi:hypothetical protein
MAVPPQRAPDVLGQSISDFLAQCRQIKTDGREALVAHHEACRRYWAENMRNGGSPPAHFPSSTAFALDKDFSRHWDEAASATAVDDECLRLKGVARIGIDEERRRHDALIERHCHDEAASAQAVDTEWLHLKEVARIGIDEERRRHDALIERHRHDKAASTKAVDNEWLRLKEVARIEIDEECRRHDALSERHRHDKAVSAKAVDDEWLRLKEVARIGIDEERQRHNDEWLRWHRIKEEVCVHHRQEAAYAKAVDNERLRLLAEERPQTTESSELAFAEVCCCHDTGMHIAMPAEGSRADERHRHEAAKQAAEPAVLRLAKNRG